MIRSIRLHTYSMLTANGPPLSSNHINLKKATLSQARRHQDGGQEQWRKGARIHGHISEAWTKQGLAEETGEIKYGRKHISMGVVWEET